MLILLPFFFNFYKCFPFVGMMTKFNLDMYAKMRSKKNEPPSNLGKRTMCITGKGPLLLQLPPLLQLSPVLRRQGKPLRPLPLWRSLLLSLKGHTWQTKGRRRLIPVRSVSGMMLNLWWKGHMRSSLLRTWSFSQACLPTRWWLIMSTDSFR